MGYFQEEHAKKVESAHLVRRKESIDKADGVQYNGSK